jgi:hypothetical protein
LPKAEQDAPHWRTAAELLMRIAEHGGDLMMARIATMRALHRREPHEAQKPRRKRAKAYRIVLGPGGAFLTLLRHGPTKFAVTHNSSRRTM